MPFALARSSSAAGGGIFTAGSAAEARAEVQRADREGERAAPAGEGGSEAREA